jgi:hypothetical protein
VPGSDRLDQFRLALSYLERVQGEIAQWDKLRADRQLDRTKYDQVRARYADHLSRATRLVDGMRSEAAHELPPSEARLKHAVDEQKKFIRRASVRGGDPVKLNEKGRALARRIAELSAEVDTLHRIAEAVSTGEFGGGVDLPLEEYPRRLDLLPEPPRRSAGRLTTAQSNLLWGAVMLVLVLGSIGGIYLWRAAPHAKFDISNGDLAGGFISVQCRNTGNRPLYLYVPWPNGRTEPTPGLSRRGNSYGVLLYVRMKGERGFRLYEGAENVWKLRGSFVEGSGPVEVRGGSTARLFVDLAKLREAGLDNVTAVAIECSGTGGAGRVRREIDLRRR